MPRARSRSPLGALCFAAKRLCIEAGKLFEHAGKILEGSDQLPESTGNGCEWMPLDASPLGARPTMPGIRSGEIEARKIGKKRLVRTASLNAWIEKHPKYGMRAAADVTDPDADLLAAFNVTAAANGRRAA